MATSLHDFSETLSELSNAELSKSMVVSIATLAEVERKLKEMQDIQAREDTITVLNTGMLTLKKLWDKLILNS